MPHCDYIRTTAGQPHLARGRQLLAAHPELRSLAGPAPVSAVWTVGLVVAQMALALATSRHSWMLWLPCAYIVGATIDHALWVLIHESCHSLITRTRVGNRAVAMVANIPLLVPGAMSFFKYHLLHHRHLGELDFDAGIPGPTEARVIGQSSALKALWIAGYIFVTGVVRPARLKTSVLDGWTVINVVFQLLVIAAFARLGGVGPFKYLVASTIFAIGFHPLGGRWIQEHFALAPDQETYSYYGPLNRVSFNAGYHNEHHDLVTIPWMHLPEIRRTAPEFYEGLASYHSWSSLLCQFISDRSLSLFTYIVRPDVRANPTEAPTAAVAAAVQSPVRRT